MRQISLENQIDILDNCIKFEKSLSVELERLGLEYDNLRYRAHRTCKSNSESVQLLDDMERPVNGLIPAVSFFTGAGGLDIGFEYAGFDNLASVEHTDLFCDTLRLNSPNKTVIGPPDYEGDISDTETIIELLGNTIGLKPGFEGVFHGGPPCQSFSIAANQRFGKNDERFKRLGFSDPERGGLFFSYVSLIEHFKPKAFLIENVAGIQDFDIDGRIKDSLEKLSLAGYEISKPTVINAADYGVPQNRFRWIVFGVRDRTSALEFPAPDTEKHISCYEVLRKPLKGVPNHITRKHTAGSVRRYMELDFGGRDKQGRVDRLDPNMPSKTIIAGGTKGGGRSHLHPYIPRTLSVRESARLQGFPDWYEFSGSNARQFTQVGNAVPPLLAYKIAQKIKEQI